MSIRTRALMALVLSVAALSVASVRAEAERTLVVIPPRYTVVKLLTDVASFRPVQVVAYDTRGEKAGLVMHVWDEANRSWVRTTLEEYRSGALFGKVPDRVMLVGSERDLPAEVVAASSSWGSKVQRIATLRVVDIVNGLDESMAFKPAEWRMLARRHGLQLTDLNEDRRRYGRYGRPGPKAEAPQVQPAPPAEVPMVPVEQEILKIEAEPAPAPLPVEGAAEPMLAPLPQDK